MNFELCYGYKAYGGQRVECGGLNRYSPYRLMCVDTWPTESGTIRWCGLVGVSVALLEEVCHWRGGHEGSGARARPSGSLSSCLWIWM